MASRWTDVELVGSSPTGGTLKSACGRCRFCGCAVVSPQSASPTAPLVREGSQLTMWRAYKAETKGR